MIITRKTGLKLIRNKKAQHVGLVNCGTATGDRLYVCITRSDLQRTDHFPAIYKDQVAEWANPVAVAAAA